MIEAKFETVLMRYFVKPFVPLVSAPVPTLRLAHNKLIINGLKILSIFLESNETLDVRNSVPSEVEVFEPGRYGNSA